MYTYSNIKKKGFVYFVLCVLACIILILRLVVVMILDSSKYSKSANDLHEREREIKAERGEILDRNGIVLAANMSVCTISVIHSQIEDEDKVVTTLSKMLDIDEEKVRKKVTKVSLREKIKSNVDKKIGDKIRDMNMAGVKVDEDYKRYYPFEMLASKVIGFTGGDNQGVVGLEVRYDKYLKGTAGKILTDTDAFGVEIQNGSEKREESIKGYNLVTSLDYNIQSYATQLAMKVKEEKNAKYVGIIVMNPKNGEIYTMVNVPEYNLNNPYEVIDEIDKSMYDNENDMLNTMWRNRCINDTYEPGSTFKIITATAGLSEGVVTPSSTFSCPGYKIVKDRRIRCHKTTGHGSEDFTTATMNSCNPVFIQVGLSVGKEKFYKYLNKLGFMEKTGIDIPGEATAILHKIENVGEVELATMSFGQSIQITPIQLLRAVSAVINGGKLVTPHFGVKIVDDDENIIEKLEYNTMDGAVEERVSETMREILEKVVSEGGGKKGSVLGYRVGGKTATSEKLPRGNGKYIASFIGYVPANNPDMIAMCIIDEPEGIYYGGTIAAPVISSLYGNILPGIEGLTIDK